MTQDEQDKLLEIVFVNSQATRSLLIRLIGLEAGLSGDAAGYINRIAENASAQIDGLTAPSAFGAELLAKIQARMDVTLGQARLVAGSAKPPRPEGH